MDFPVEFLCDINCDIDTTPIKTNKVVSVNYTPIFGEKLYLTKSGVFIPFSVFTLDETLSKENNIIALFKNVSRIENYFTLTTETITKHLIKISSCKVDKKNNRIIVPRFGIFEILIKKFKLDNRFSVCSLLNEGEDFKTPILWTGKLNANQQLISKVIIDNYFTPQRVACGSAGVIVNLEAGQGKSFLAAYLISHIQKKTAIILHSTSLLEQWSNVLKTVFGDKVSIGYYYGLKKKDGDIVLMIIDSATKDEFTINGKTLTALEYYNQFGFVIYDECHLYANKSSLKALKAASTPYVLGLSATPDENPNNFDKLVWWQLGSVLNCSEIPNYSSKSENFNAKVHRIMYYGPTNYTKQIINKITNLTSTSETINMICRDDIRTALVIECILKCRAANLYTFVFADRREYLTHLRYLLNAMSKVLVNVELASDICESEDDFIRIVGGSSARDLETAETKCKVIFTTYQYMGTGKSIVKMNGLVLATPRKSKMKQYINRIFRLGSDASVTRQIYDICDMKLKLSTQWNKRLDYYNSKNYTISTDKIKYDQYEKLEHVAKVIAYSSDVNAVDAFVESDKVKSANTKKEIKQLKQLEKTKVKSTVEKNDETPKVKKVKVKSDVEKVKSTVEKNDETPKVKKIKVKSDTEKVKSTVEKIDEKPNFEINEVTTKVKSTSLLNSLKMPFE